jgi:large subunit ribosomal protein L25
VKFKTKYELMSDTISIQGTLRLKSGTGAARSLRLKGEVPAVIYGNNQQTLCLSIPHEDAEALYHDFQLSAKVVQITLDGKQYAALPKQFSVHPVTSKVEHADFLYTGTTSHPIKIKIPVKLKGKNVAPGIKKGGVINLVFRSLPCRVPSDKVPPFIEIDISKAEVGLTLTLADLNLPPNVKLMMPNMSQTLLRMTGKRKVVEELEIAKPESAEAAAAGTGEGSAKTAASTDTAKEKAADSKK